MAFGSALQIEAPQPTRPRVLVGVSLALLSTLGWIGESTLVTRAVSLLLLGLAGFLLLTGRARRGVVRFEPETCSVLSTLGRDPAQHVTQIELHARPGDLQGRPRASYAAVAVGTDGRRREVYEAADPSDLLRWGRALEGHVPVTVTWAEGRRLLDWLEAHPAANLGSAPQQRIVGHADANRARLARLLIATALVMGSAWTAFITASEAEPSALSVAVAVGSVLFILLTSALVLSDHTVFEIGDIVRIERRRLGWTVSRLALPRAHLWRVVPLAPAGSSGYLVLLTDSDVFSVPLTEPQVSEVARALTLGATAGDSPAHSGNQLR